MSNLVVLADAALVAWILYLILRPWVHGLRMGVSFGPGWVFGKRVEGKPPILLIDAFVAQRKLGDEIPMSVIEAAWRANRKNIRNAGELAHYARQMRDQLPAA